MSNSTVLVIPFPAQGHVNSLMHFSHKLVKHGFKITFVNTEFNHRRVLNSIAQKESPALSELIEFVTIPDGLGPDDDRNDVAKLCSAMLNAMPALFEKLVTDIIASSDGNNRISCIVADVNVAWALEVARKLRIRGAALWTASAAIFATQYNIPTMIDNGIIDCNGFPTQKRTFQLYPRMPVMNTSHIFWTTMGDSTSQKSIFDYNKGFTQILDLIEWWFCNTTYELEPGTLSSIPKLLPIGPLVGNYCNERSVGQFWEEDLSCMSWLDQHPPCSVIYVAFGSFTVFEPTQFKEIAVGLKLTNRPFLWVVRSDTSYSTKIIKDIFPYESSGKIVGWAPQWKVLSHPATACFISHCGWNSTMDGVCNGVPFLCWPYFGDQIFNKTYICDEWQVGLGFDSDENGLVPSGEINKKVDQLSKDENIRTRSLKLKETVMNNIARCGQSSEIFNKFAKWLKE